MPKDPCPQKQDSPQAWSPRLAGPRHSPPRSAGQSSHRDSVMFICVCDLREAGAESVETPWEANVATLPLCAWCAVLRGGGSQAASTPFWEAGTYNPWRPTTFPTGHQVPKASFYKRAHKAGSQSGSRGSGTAKATGLFLSSTDFPPLSGPRLGAWPRAEPDTHIHLVVSASAWEGKED